MTDYKITNGDISIANGDISLISEPEATAQRIEQKFRLWRGEWFVDTEAGFPWMQDILGQRPRPEVVRSLVHDLITGDAGISTVSELNIEIRGRHLSIRFRATKTTGEIEEMEVTI